MCTLYPSLNVQFLKFEKFCGRQKKWHCLYACNINCCPKKRKPSCGNGCQQTLQQLKDPVPVQVLCFPYQDSTCTGTVLVHICLKISIKLQEATCHSEASRCGCVGLHLHGAAGEGAVGGVAAAALAALPPSTAVLSLRSGESMSQSMSAPPATSGFPWSTVGPQGGPLLHKDKLGHQINSRNEMND